MLVISEVKCPYCGMKAQTFSGGFINRPATKAYCPHCQKEFPVNLTPLQRLKGILKGFTVIQ